MKFLTVAILIIGISSCDMSANYYDTERAISLAIEFSEKAFIRMEYNSIEMLSDELKSQMTESNFLETISKMHPYGTPNYIENKVYTIDPNRKSILIIIEAGNDLDTYYYSISLDLSGDDYKINGFNVFNNTQFQKIQNDGVMDCPLILKKELKDVPANEMNIELIKQNKRKQFLYKASGAYKNMKITDDISIKLESISQIYFPKQTGWALIVKYRTDKNIDDTVKIEKDAITIFEKKVLDNAQACETNGVAILAVEDIDKSYAEKRSQYGATFIKKEDGSWVRNKK